MDMNNRKRVYVCGRNQDMNLGLAAYNGRILIQIPNYTQVFFEKPTPVHTNEFVYAVLAPADKVKECVERGAGGEVTVRLWDGPRESRGLPQNKVQCVIASLDGTGDEAVAILRRELEIQKRVNDDLLAKISELKRGAEG
jgi:hypothetical protein